MKTREFWISAKADFFLNSHWVSAWGECFALESARLSEHGSHPMSALRSKSRRKMRPNNSANHRAQNIDHNNNGHPQLSRLVPEIEDGADFELSYLQVGHPNSAANAHFNPTAVSLGILASPYGLTEMEEIYLEVWWIKGLVLIIMVTRSCLVLCLKSDAKYGKRQRWWPPQLFPSYWF